MSFDLHQQCLRNQGYEPICLLGQGSFSSVYTVQDAKSKRLKAVKIIENQLVSFSADESRWPTGQVNNLKAQKSIEDMRRKKLRQRKAGQKYFNREILTSKRLIQGFHPHVVKIFAIKRTFLYTYIYMEHLSKGNLSDYLNQTGPLEPGNKLAKLWIYSLASALDYLHSIGIAHRDVKLQNIALTEQLGVKLIDFGFACRCLINRTSGAASRRPELRINETMGFGSLKSDLPVANCRSAESILPGDKHLTSSAKTSSLINQPNAASSPEQVVQFSMSQCGTPLFIAPEVIIADKCPYDPRKADVWSLGVTMFAIISYRYPFTKRDYKILYRQQLRRSWLSKRVYTCFSTDALDLINRMLEPMPKKRFTASQVMNHCWIRTYFAEQEPADDFRPQESDQLANRCDLKSSNDSDSNKQMRKLALIDDETTRSSDSEPARSASSDESSKMNEPISKSILSTRTGMNSQSCI